MNKFTLLQTIVPDWQATWKANEIEKELPGFEMKGPGWYIKDQTSMLVMGTDKPDVYIFSAFFDRDPRPAFAILAQGPVQLMTGLPATSLSVKSKPITSMGKLVYFLGIILLVLVSKTLVVNLGVLGILMIFVLGIILIDVASYISAKSKDK